MFSQIVFHNLNTNISLKNWDLKFHIVVVVSSKARVDELKEISRLFVCISSYKDQSEHMQMREKRLRLKNASTCASSMRENTFERSGNLIKRLKVF